MTVLVVAAVQACTAILHVTVISEDILIGEECGMSLVYSSIVLYIFLSWIYKIRHEGNKTWAGTIGDHSEPPVLTLFPQWDWTICESRRGDVGQWRRQYQKSWAWLGFTVSRDGDRAGHITVTDLLCRRGGGVIPSFSRGRLPYVEMGDILSYEQVVPSEELYWYQWNRPHGTILSGEIMLSCYHVNMLPRPLFAGSWFEKENFACEQWKDNFYQGALFFLAVVSSCHGAGKQIHFGVKRRSWRKRRGRDGVGSVRKLGRWN